MKKKKSFKPFAEFENPSPRKIIHSFIRGKAATAASVLKY